MILDIIHDKLWEMSEFIVYGNSSINDIYKNKEVFLK